MAKMFYTMEEARAALGRTEEEIKQLSRDGRLREFRDGQRLMFKADQVEQLKAELASGAEPVDLGVSDSGGLIGLVDTAGASGTSITLSEDTHQGTSPGEIHLKDDTAMPGDLGLGGSMGGSMGGIPSPSNRSGTSIPLAGSIAGGTSIPLAGSMAGGTVGGATVGGTVAGGSMAGRSGINVLSDADAEPVDPLAQTAISGGRDYSGDAIGSGSGLLDLTRESDDTSLGAVLDEITPGGSSPGQRSGFGSAAGGVMLEEPAAAARFVAPATAIVERYDPMALAFGMAALAGAIFLILGILALMSAAQGVRPPEMLDTLYKGQFLMVFGIGMGLAILLFIIGMLAGKAGGNRAR